MTYGQTIALVILTASAMNIESSYQKEAEKVANSILVSPFHFGSMEKESTRLRSVINDQKRTNEANAVVETIIKKYDIS